MASKIFHGQERVEVKGFSGLLADFVLENGGDVLIRGLRAASDFESEFQMAGMNQHLMPKIITVFLVPTKQHLFISSTLVREVASMGGDVSEFVSEGVLHCLEEKFQERVPP